MNWKHHQQFQSDPQDQEFLEEQILEDNQNPLGQDEVDALDAFMNTLQQQQKPKQKENKTSKNKEINKDYSDDQDQGINFNLVQNDQFRENRSNDQILSNEQQNTLEKKNQKKIIESLKPFDFSSVQLQDFQKNFYDQHPEITGLSELEVKKIMKQMEIKASGANTPRPIVSFGHIQFQQKLKRQIVKQKFQKPTPIQAIALPAALSGRDIVGIAKTGSGKTLAYVLPLIVHVSYRPPSHKNEGPSAIVLAPTRQLCQQIYLEIKKYSKRYDFRINCLLGGQNKHDQWKALKAGVDILIASPGRLIQMLKKKATSLIRVTYLVLDEADRMLSLGFQQQIRSIVGQTRQDRQTLLFTATMKKQMQFLVNDIITTPIRINIGQQGAANQDVKQEVVMVGQRQQKFQWMIRNFNDLTKIGKVLVFANQRETCQQIGKFIEERLGISSLVLHGEKNQYQRTIIMNSFKGEGAVLVATDIAARGIDVKNIKTVVNFECPKQIESYIHRIGRAGRAGETGRAYTFLSSSDVKFAIALVKTFQNSGYPVPQELEDLACLDDFFKRKRLSAKMGVSFAKGKDASKFLTQIIKKQRSGFNRAGLGLEDPKNRNSITEPTHHILSGEKNTKNLSISEISSLIKQKYEQSSQREEKFGHFVKSASGPLNQTYKEATIHYPKKKEHQ